MAQAEIEAGVPTVGCNLAGALEGGLIALAVGDVRHLHEVTNLPFTRLRSDALPADCAATHQRSKVRHKSGAVTFQEETARHALDALSLAIMVVDPSLRLIHANDAANAIFARPKAAFGLRQGRLVAHNQAGNATLKQIVTGCLRQPGSANRGDSHLLLRGSGHEERGLSVCAVAIPAGCGLSERLQDVMIVARPLAVPTNLARAAQQLFSLTPGEAKLAAALASGMSLTQAAQGQRVRLSTARTHLARVFEKTGTHQQSQVAVLLRSAELPVRTTGPDRS